MQKINLKDVPETERRSPKGKYYAFYQEVSVALGSDFRSPVPTNKHPFDLMRVRLPAGATLCPFHAHSAQWEMYFVLSGRGTVRDDTGMHEVTAGDSFIFRPGEAHQISNTGTEEFVYFVIADNPAGDCCLYPDSKKILFTGGTSRMIVKGEEAEYLDGEE